jgi:hypothetical protein
MRFKARTGSRQVAEPIEMMGILEFIIYRSKKLQNQSSSSRGRKQAWWGQKRIEADRCLTISHNLSYISPFFSKLTLSGNPRIRKIIYF